MRAQKGNAIFLVLVGIVLFAALTYTFARTSLSKGDPSGENARVYAQQIISYAERMNGAVQIVMLQNGCHAADVSFENSTIAGYEHAPVVPTQCQVFDSAGGAMTFDAPPPEALDTVAAAASASPAGALVGDYFFTGKSCVDSVGTGDFTTCAADSLANEEILMFAPWVTAEVCAAINKILGHSTTMLQDNNGSFDDTKYTGAVDEGYAIGRAAFTTYPVGCYESTGATSPGAGHHFYYTLITR